VIYLLVIVTLSLALGAYWLLVLTEGAYLGKATVVAMYDWGAPTYDRVKNILPSDDAEHLVTPLLAKMDGMASPLVLDVAAGTGRLSLALLRQWGFRGRVVGLDMSRAMLALASAKTQGQRHRAAWVRQDAMCLPFASGRFDAVTCIEALEFMPQPSAVLTELARVLRPGGQLLISNRTGLDARFFPKRVVHTERLVSLLNPLGLTHVETRRWQVHYDLVQAEKEWGNGLVERTATASSLSRVSHS
jgi:2-polyprenyl-3-methyl-5-hydroxy-6-metoxy-1,4-benzoquinol methylase